MAKARGFYVEVRPQAVLGKIRDARGRFVRYEWASQAHQDAAYKVAQFMAEELEEKVARRAARRGFPARATRHLRRALTQEGNWRPARGTNWAFGFQVGLASHLDASPAREYWRNLEYGTDIFVGRPLAMTPRGPRDISRFAHSRFRGRSGAPVAVVENAIPAYAYLREGGRRGREWAHANIKDLYRRYDGPPMK